jgi:hypothetical protein
MHVEPWKRPSLDLTKIGANNFFVVLEPRNVAIDIGRLFCFVHLEPCGEEKVRRFIMSNVDCC